jgi:sphingolipid delta-4 desaturase
VGWHNEHHDFPFIAGAKLPQLRLIAPEFYEGLPYHGSWISVITSYVLEPLVGPHSRIKRNTLPAADRAWVLAGGDAAET